MISEKFEQKPLRNTNEIAAKNGSNMTATRKKRKRNPPQ